jgi:hypothetical protein
MDDLHIDKQHVAMKHGIIKHTGRVINSEPVARDGTPDHPITPWDAMASVSNKTAIQSEKVNPLVGGFNLPLWLIYC